MVMIMLLRYAKGKRGQVLSYDALGGAIIFIIAMGILFTYWSALSSSSGNEDADLVLEANQALDNLMRPGALLNDDGYSLNEQRFGEGRECNIDADEVGLVHEYYISVIDADGTTLASCGTMPPPNVLKIVTAERISVYDDKISKITLNVYVT